MNLVNLGCDYQLKIDRKRHVQQGGYDASHATVRHDGWEQQQTGLRNGDMVARYEVSEFTSTRRVTSVNSLSPFLWTLIPMKKSPTLSCLIS